MEKETYYKYLFLSAAIWNIFVSLTCFFVSIFMIDIATLFGMETPPSLMWLHFYFGCVFVFGIGFLIVFQDINKNHGVVVLGIAEKFLIFGGSLIYFILGDFNFTGVLLVLIDLVYGCLFIEFLLNFKKLRQ